MQTGRTQVVRGTWLGVLVCLSWGGTVAAQATVIRGVLRPGYPLTLDVAGPETHELAAPNPFLDVRLEVTFRHAGRSYRVPGTFAADGRAAETGATAGSVWRVRFTPDAPGDWTWEVSFRAGRAVAVSPEPRAGTPLAGDGLRGRFEVTPLRDNDPRWRRRGRLVACGGHRLIYAGTGEPYVTAGAGSPENLLAYVDFDGTYYGGDNRARSGEDVPQQGLHRYAPHERDWRAGDPTWRGGKGKGLIGALNYLAAKGMNSVYFLTMNVLGDGDDVWPWIERNERYRFDCSKLDQWEIVFAHMESLGLGLHVVLQETENELLLDSGRSEVQRRLYYRELVARFGHHLALVWDLGEENGPADWTPHGQDTAMQKAMADALAELDPYDHPIVIHTHADRAGRDRIITPLLGHATLDGLALQVGRPTDVHAVTADWIARSRQADHPWVVSLDEIGPAHTGAMPDANDPEHDTLRREALWGHLMAGGGGVQWYFGYRYAHADLSCEDWRSRDRLWDQTRIAVDFFRTHLGDADLAVHDELVMPDGTWCLARPGERYAVYVPAGGAAALNLGAAPVRYTVRWFDPRHGGDLQSGSVPTVRGPGQVYLGNAPGDRERDWVVLLRP